MKVVDIPSGYACIDRDNSTIWIPAIMTDNLKYVLEYLYCQTGFKKMIFSSILEPAEFKTHLKNIKREWDELVEKTNDYSHCIEIEYDTFRPHKPHHIKDCIYKGIFKGNEKNGYCFNCLKTEFNKKEEKK